MMFKNKHHHTGFSSLILIGVAGLLAAALGLGLSFLYSKSSSSSDSKARTISPTNVINPPAASKEGKTLPISDWIAYRDPKSGLNLKHPRDWGAYPLSFSLVVAPQDTINKIKVMVKNGVGFEGGTYLTMQIFVEDGSSITEVRENSFSEATKKKTTLGTRPADLYEITYTEDLLGIEKGTKTAIYVLDIGKERVRIDLLDLSQRDILEKIAATVNFSSPSAGNGSYVGKTLDEIKDLLGLPVMQRVNIERKREIWVYQKSADDSTADYYYFQDGKVAEIKTDEFNGSLEGDPFLQ